MFASSRRIAVLAICALLLVHVALFFQPVEDAYISFRYARNLAGGEGLVFNPGERVEGYTNFLWVVLLAGAGKLGASIEWSALLLGTALAIATVLLAAALGRVLCPGSPGAGIPAALFLACSPSLAMWAGAGLEAPLFSFLALLTAWLWGRERDTSASVPWRWPVAAFLASLARPDGVLIFAVAVVASLDRRPRSLRRALAAACVYAALGIPYMLWRWWYFGALLPNTYHAKVVYGVDTLIHGLAYLQVFLLFAGGVTVFLGALLTIPPRDARARLLLAIGGTYAVYVVAVGGEGYPYGRFLLPVLVLLAPVAELGWRRAWGLATRRGLVSREAGGATAAAALVVLLLPGIAGSRLGRERMASDANEGVNARRRAIGEWLRRTAAPGDLLAVNPAGVIPYVSGLRTIDMLGLTDAHIGRLGTGIHNRRLFGHNRYDAEYVLSRRPEFLILGQATPLVVDPRMEEARRPGPATFDAVAPAVVRDFNGFPGDAVIWDAPAFRRQYVPTIVESDLGHFYCFVLDRPAIELESRIASAVDPAPLRAELARLLSAKGAWREAAVEARAAAEAGVAAEPGLAAILATGSAREAIARADEAVDRGDLLAAIEHLSAAESADPSNARIPMNLGTLYEQLDRPDDAMAAYRRAVQIRPDFADALNNLGTLSAARGDTTRAREWWERAVAADPAHVAGENLQRLARESATERR